MHEGENKVVTCRTIEKKTQSHALVLLVKSTVVGENSLFLRRKYCQRTEQDIFLTCSSKRGRLLA